MFQSRFAFKVVLAVTLFMGVKVTIEIRPYWPFGFGVHHRTFGDVVPIQRYDVLQIRNTYLHQYTTMPCPSEANIAVPISPN